MRLRPPFLILAALCAACFALPACAGEARSQPESVSPVTADTIVYYFHGTSRCHTCKTIESYTGEALKGAFAEELRRQEVAWVTRNVDEPANRHFIKDYQLYTRSVVVVDGSNPKRFRVLDKVWQLVDDKPAFLKYVADEVRTFRVPKE